MSQRQSQSFCQNRRKSPILGLGLALGVGLGLEGILRDLGDHEALEGRKTNREEMRLATEIPNPVSDLT